MSLPNLPPFYSMVYTDKEGNMTPESIMYNDNMFQTLNELVRQVNNGFQHPQKTTPEISVYRDDTDVPTGTVWFDTDKGKLVVKTKLGNPPSTPGTIETITSS